MRGYLSEETVTVGLCPCCGMNAPHHIALFRLAERLQIR